MRNPLDLLSSAKVDNDYETALQEQRKIQEEHHEKQRQLQEAEWKGLELAQKLEQEDKDLILAAQLAEKEKQEVEMERQLRMKQAEDDHKAVLLLLQKEEEEIKQRKEQLLKVAQEDASLAAKLQNDEQIVAYEEALKAKAEEERKYKEENWIEPVVHCDQDDERKCMCVWVTLPGLGHTDVTVTPESKDCTIISIAALSADQKKQFFFDLKLKGDELLNITPNDVQARYDQTNGSLEVCIFGIKMTPVKSFVDKLKQVFSFLVPKKE